MKTEATLVLYVYLSVAVSTLAIFLMFLAFMWFKKVIEKYHLFAQLIIGLYEEEKQKKERRDIGGNIPE